MNEVKFVPSAYFPSLQAEITLLIGDKKITCKYENRNQGERQFYLNGKRLQASFDELRNTPYVIVDKKALENNSTLLIID